MDVTSKQKNKIIKYIIDDRPKKLGKYIDKHEIQLNAIVTRKGEKMLHLCAREGATDCLEFLINKGCKVNLVDASGNLPLHLALEYCLQHYSHNIEQNLVSFLLTYSANHVHRQNFQGVSPKDLLDKLNALTTSSSKPESPISVSSDDSDGREYSDKKWREKLEYECDYEFEANLGKFEATDDYWKCAGGAEESYDSWADRIFQAFSARQRQSYASKYTPKAKTTEPEKKRNNLRPEPAPSTSKQDVEKLREKRKRAKNLEMYKKLFESQDEIGVGDIPFENLKPGEILDIMLQDIVDADVIKRTIREELRRWHPDKFKQKLGGRVKEGMLDQVMDKVKTIAQALTSFAK